MSILMIVYGVAIIVAIVLAATLIIQHRKRKARRRLLARTYGARPQPAEGSDGAEPVRFVK